MYAVAPNNFTIKIKMDKGTGGPMVTSPLPCLNFCITPSHHYSVDTLESMSILKTVPLATSQKSHMSYINIYMNGFKLIK